MPGAYKRASDRARGKAGKWTIWYIAEDGRKRERAGFTDKARSVDEAIRLEAEARKIRDGVVDPRQEKRRHASLRSAGAHVGDYRGHLIAKGGTPKHAGHVAGVLNRLLDLAGVATIADLAPDRIQEALGLMRDRGKSARTCNHARGAVRAFARWLHHAGRIAELPPGIAALATFNEKEDARLVRRALSPEEVARLLAAAGAGAPVVAAYGATKSKHHATMITGPERRVLYLLAMSTGFRADELRNLTPEAFHLEGDSPTITCAAAYTKNGREAVQPIRRDVAAELAPWLATRPPGAPVLPVPEKTAELLARDLKAAGIAPVDEAGRVVDFHALRASFITNLYRKTRDPKAVQKLARHSTITLTMDRYCKLEDADVRAALEDEPRND
jgi:integrase/recombinase XerD